MHRHSLIGLSGAMVLKLQDVDNSLIMKISGWLGLTFLTYFHTQIDALNTAPLASQWMTTCIHFVNVAG